eukprot:GFUD01033574.1.p1 GENE.GFUD01033574.1~~GFUD01033574.1.p1  ORF type:complete len:505 (-),score=68.91 GFUD01033574.1:56-1570(-)
MSGENTSLTRETPTSNGNRRQNSDDSGSNADSSNSGGGSSKAFFIRTIIPFLMLQFSVGLCASLQATFYPIEAGRKGATASQFGAVFGIIHLSLFIFGPLVGKYLSIWGVKAIFPAGFIIDGGTFILFGMLQWVNDTTMFLVFSYLIRFLEGVGAAATWTSNLSILMAKFPERKATVKAWCDASFNFGLTIGPVLGAFMYDAGGFFLPFAVTGTAILLSGVTVLLVTDFPDMEHGDADLPVMKILTNPRVLIALLTCTIGAYSVGTIEATLSPFLELMGLNIKQIAVAFLVMSLCSVLATPIFGYLCDAAFSPWIISGSGCVFMFVCYCFIGPVPYLAFFKASFPTVCGSLVAQGFGCAAVLVASFGSAQNAAISAGFSESMEIQAVVSGLFTSSFALGNFCGPTISGILFDSIGFDYNCLVLQALVVIILVLNIVCFVIKPSPPEYLAIEDTEPLVQPDRRDSVFPELAADVIRTRPTPARRHSRLRKYSTSLSVYERNAVVY